VQFEDDTLYDFTQSISTSKIVSFVPKSKGLWTQPPDIVDFTSNNTPLTQFPLEELVAFKLTRHFKSLGNSAKLLKSDSSSRALIDVSAYYNSIHRYEEAKMYAQSACNAALNNLSTKGLAQAQLIVSLCGLQLTANAEPCIEVLTLYKQALAQIEWEYGVDHIVSLALHDRMCYVYEQCKRKTHALDFIRTSLRICLKSLGKHHLISAGYKVKAAIIMSELDMNEEALKYFVEALHILSSIQADHEVISEAHYHIANILFNKGDVEGAISHSQKCKKQREGAFGQQDPRTVEVYIQLSNFILSPYTAHNGLVTPQIRHAYKEVINCDEKVFRHLKTLNSSTRNSNLLSSKRSVSQLSIATTTKSLYTNSSQRYNIEAKINIHPVSGPFFASPFTSPIPLGKNLLHKITKQIVHLKIELLEAANHKETVRKLRMSHLGKDICPSEAKRVIMRLVAVSPSVYMDGIMARTEDNDDEALEELSMLLQLTENEVVGVQQ